MIIWFTGLSGAGKSTLAEALSQKMKSDGIIPLMIDGDVMRLGLTADLGYGVADRSENVRRAGGVAVISARSGIISICSLISPLRKDRELVRAMAQAHGVPFIEIFVDTPLEICEKRDPKGLYRRARSGQILDFTGISSPYEPPLRPELVAKTADTNIDETLKQIYECISGLECYTQISRISKVEKLLARLYFSLKKLIPRQGSLLRRISPWIVPPIYLMLVVTIDFILPIRSIANPLLAIGIMAFGLSLRPRLMLLWTLIYIFVDGLLLFCRPVYDLVNASSGDFDTSVNAVRLASFVCTSLFSMLVSWSLTRLRDRVNVSRVLLPRMF